MAVVLVSVVLLTTPKLVMLTTLLVLMVGSVGTANARLMNAQ
jgi:hypothetical protein